MTPAFDDLPVALPPGCAGVRVAISTAGQIAGEEPHSARRVEFLAGRLAAAEALRLIGLDDVGILARTPAGAPAWPDGVTGSLSHHSGIACAVVSAAASGVGVDIAPLLGEAQLRAVVRRCLSEPERARWQTPRDVALVFAAKESIYKAVHPRSGRHIGFDEAEVIEQSGGEWTARLDERLASDIGIRWVSGTYAWESNLVYTALALEG